VSDTAQVELRSGRVSALECRELLKSRIAQMESVSAAGGGAGGGAGGANAKGKWKAASSKALRFGWMAE